MFEFNTGMKISALNRNYIFNNNIKTKPFNIINSAASDVFVKSPAVVSFSANNKFSQKFYPYKKEITDYVLNSPQVTLQGIEEILTKYSPKTKVVERKSNDPHIAEDCISFAERPITLGIKGFNFIAQEGPKKIHISLPRENTKEKRVRLLGSLIHESTHIFQEESDDRTSTLDKYNKIFRDSKKFQITYHTVASQLYASGFHNLESSLLYTLAQSVNDIMEEPHLINTTPEKLIKDKFKNLTGLYIDTYIRKIINEIINNAEKQFNEIDRKSVLEMFAFRASIEKEAYQNQADSVKEVMGITGFTTMDVKAALYDFICRTANSMNKEIK